MARAKYMNDEDIRKLKLPKDREKYQTLGDGLYIKLTPTGKRVFYHFGKTRKWHKMGEFPTMKLAEARKRTADLKIDTDQGIDPTEINTPLTDPTVREFYDYWYGKAADKEGRPWSDLYKRNVQHIFNADILPKIGGMKLASVRKAHVTQIIDAVLDRGATSHARQVYLRLQRFLNYAGEIDLIEVSPMATMATKGTANAKERALKAEEIKVFFKCLQDADMTRQTAGVLEMILRTGQRPGECAGIHKDEVTIETREEKDAKGKVLRSWEENWWTIPGSRTKNKLPQRVFLPESVKHLLGEPGPKGYYFGSFTLKRKRSADAEKAEFLELPLHTNAISKALRRSLTGREKRKGDTAITLPIAPFTPHDLRRSCATHLAELGFNDDIIGAVLNHKKRSVTGIYNRHQYDAEKKRAMLAWDRKLAAILTGKPLAEVVNIK